MHQLGEGQGQHERRHEQQKQWIPFNTYNAHEIYRYLLPILLFIDRVHQLYFIKRVASIFFNIFF